MTTKTDWLLIFTFSPVQGFISGAKKTRDLYAGSYFLSFLTRRVLEELCKSEHKKKINIIYPQADKVGKGDPYWGKIVGNYPNRFVAKIENATEEEVKQIVQTLKKTFNEEFETLSDNLKKHLVWENLREIYLCPENAVNVENLREAMDQIDQQVKGYFQSFVAAVPLRDCDKDKNKKDCYKKVYELAERTLGGRKTWRRYAGEVDGSAYKKEGDKEACHFPDGCTSCGEHLHLAVDWKTFKKHLQRLKNQQKTEKDEDKEITSVGDGEKLCSLCLVKRKLYKLRLKKFFEELSLKEQIKGKLKQAIERFPSTHDIALAKEKFEFFKALRNYFLNPSIEHPIDSQELAERLEDLVNRFKDEGALTYGINKKYREEIEKLLESLVLTKSDLDEKTKNFMDYAIDSLKIFWQISAEYLSTDYVERLIKTLEELKEQQETQKDITVETSPKELKEKIKVLQKWLETLKNLYRGLKEATGEDFESKFNKVPYFAMVYSDGDNIGKILGGEEGFISQKYEGKLSEKFHKDFSLKLSEYAYETAKEVEEPNNGESVGFARVIYAGGDDLFAFLHPAEVIRVLNIASENYKKHLKEVLNEDKATTSAGLVIGHAKVSLKYLHKKTKEAENEAKKKFCKNAFVIKVISRSGEETSFGAKYSYDELKTLDLLSKAVELYKKGKISSKLPYALREIADRFVPEEEENQKKECENKNPCEEKKEIDTSKDKEKTNPCEDKEEIAQTLPFKIAKALLERELNRKISSSKEDKKEIESFKNKVIEFFNCQRIKHQNLKSKELLKNLAAMFYVARTLAEREAFTLSEGKNEAN